MEIQLYQINMDRDVKGLCFMPQEYLERTQAQPKVIDSSIYDLVFEGVVECRTLEDVYRKFNAPLDRDYGGRSMSVSDIVVVKEADGTQTAHFCDSIGFAQVEFDTSRAMTRETALTVVLLEPGKLARVTQIKNSLRDMQRVVGGLIEPCYCFEEEVCLVCHEEGKLIGLPLNRSIYHPETGEMMDIIAGPCFICACGGEDFQSLSPEQQTRYLERFRRPEKFLRKGQEILAIPYTPVKSGLER